MVKILHCGDMHLDSPFATEDAQSAARRRNELSLAFVNMMMYAKSNDISLIILPGDLFDSDEPSPDTVEMVRREFENAHNIKIVIAPGNHDPYLKGGVWDTADFSDNVFIFKDNSLSRFDFDEFNLSVYGYAFVSSRMTSLPFSPTSVEGVDRSRINILCAHADLTRGSSDYCPISPADIANSPFDYIALAHIHERTEPAREGSTYYSYCGCLEGRDFGECGCKGATVAILDKDSDDATFSIKSAFVRFSRRRYEIETLDVTGMKTNAEMESAFAGIVKNGAYGEDTLLRLVVTGQAAAALHISHGVFEPKAKGICYLEVRDESIPALDYEALEDDRTVRGAFFESLRTDLFGEDENKKAIAERALRIGLAALADGDLSAL